MNNFDLILKGAVMYPSIDDKYISLVLKVDMKENYKKIFGVDISFEEFIEKLKNDDYYRKEILESINNYYGISNLKLITNSSYDTWYFVNYRNRVNDNYNLNYVIKVGTLNTFSIMDDYVDLFNNNIVYKAI